MAKIIAPVVTIFNEEEKPDYAGNKKVIDFLIEGGLDGILVLGSAGEFPDLNEQERLDFFRFYAEYVNGRVELLAGTGCIRYADTLALSNAVYELGYTPMVISPYYFEMDQEKLFVYYDRLAKDVKGDLYLYNFPPRTGATRLCSAVSSSRGSAACKGASCHAVSAPGRRAAARSLAASAAK